MFKRYAVYYTPEGELASCGAAWLGWDIARGEVVAQPHIEGLNVADLTRRPRRYGLHATIKPPFSLAPGTSRDDLLRELEALGRQSKTVTLEGVEVRVLGGFCALTAIGDTKALSDLAAVVVTELDRFRAPPSEEELARRRRANLTRAQERNLENWGYPYVMEEFRFHISLTGWIKGSTEIVATRLGKHFEPHLPNPFAVNSLTLAGEDDEGMFHTLHRIGLQS